MLHQSVRQLIADRYRVAHGAAPAIDYPAYCVVESPAGPQATLGYRRASDGALFLEAYLDAPVETVVSERVGRAVGRSRIVEIGDHASRHPHSTLMVWTATARQLTGEADIAVAVLTRTLRAMFRRIGLPFLEIVAASPDRLGPERAGWGSYYDSEPVVCAGEIAAGRACLDRWCASEIAA